MQLFEQIDEQTCTCIKEVKGSEQASPERLFAQGSLNSAQKVSGTQPATSSLSNFLGLQPELEPRILSPLAQSPTDWQTEQWKLCFYLRCIFCPFPAPVS